MESVSTVAANLAESQSGQEDLQQRYAVARKLLHLLIPAALLERRRITPRVVVEGEEIAALVLRATVHILSHFVSIALHICGRIADGNLSVPLETDVLLHIASRGLDVRRTVGVVVRVDDLPKRNSVSDLTAPPRKLT